MVYVFIPVQKKSSSVDMCGFIGTSRFKKVQLKDDLPKISNFY